MLLASRRLRSHWSRRRVITRGFHQEVVSERSLSLEDFKDRYFGVKPVILKQYFAQLPAIQSWPAGGFEYLRKYGNKSVPVELARQSSTYASEDDDGSFEQIEIPLSTFLDVLLKVEAEPDASDIKVYLAQHALFDSVPELYKDVCLASFRDARDGRLKVPEYATAGKGDLYNVNIWIGHSTHTPLHHDPYHNIFAQLYNSKKVMIFPPDAKSELSFHTDHLKKNSSTIKDIFDQERYDQLPTHIQDQSQHATLQPGDGLYIPQGWLHSLKGEEKVSSSVNWWFR